MEDWWKYFKLIEELMVEICILGFFELFCSRDSNSYGFINLTIRTGLKFGSNQHKFIIMSNS